MGITKIEDLRLTPLNIIKTSGGDVLHAIKKTDPGYLDFGEAYFSIVERGAIKAWKRHQVMTMNLVVPVGSIRFVFFDDREETGSKGNLQVVELSREHYCRLTVPPRLWMGFQGVGAELNLLLNVADIPHNSVEADRKDINEIEFDWSIAI